MAQSRAEAALSIPLRASSSLVSLLLLHLHKASVCTPHHQSPSSTLISSPTDSTPQHQGDLPFL
uniref:Transmembrane protein n=1 Tax=Medicago truncatula TaxID=3880 RepID=I3SA28_MEDTR|nr:unknown [Medicago truncatula]